MPGAPALRAAVRAAYGTVPHARRGAWAQFESDVAGRWNALWDVDTSAPLRIFGSGIAAPMASSDPAVAEATARLILERHLPLLCPGMRPSELALVSDAVSLGMRTVAFEARPELAPGFIARAPFGHVSFRFKNDRLFVIAGECADVVRDAPRTSANAAATAARAAMTASHGRVSVDGAPELVVVPFVPDSSVAPRPIAARPAWRVRIEAADPPGRYDVYVDARSGAPVARDALFRFGDGTARFDAPIRSPQSGRRLYPARALHLVVDGASETTDDEGAFAWSGPADATVSLGVVGDAVDVGNVAGTDVSATLDAPDGAGVEWSLADDEMGDAQLSAFVHAGIVKARARSIAPEMGFLDAPLNVYVNRPDDQGCNAYWDGYSLNFLRQNASCNNSARVADVVYHEFGHGFHQHAIIAGVGAFEAALSEGAGDYMAATNTGDPTIGPGFFLNGDPIRSLKPNRRWPDDIDADPHMTGLIFAGSMWDVRAGLFAQLGREGIAIADRLYYGVLQQASSIPTTYVDAIAADDDDGDLTNGTPHICVLNEAFAEHGLAPVLNAAGLTLSHDPATLVSPGTPYYVSATAHVLYPQCDSGGLDDVRIELEHGDVKDTVHLTAEGDTWSGELPAEPAGTELRYKLVATAGDIEVAWPNNPADPEYSVFYADQRVLSCNDFEHDVSGWTFGDSAGHAEGFEWGTPRGKAGDPDHAFSGTKVFGNDLGNGSDGRYLPRSKTHLDAPAVDVGDERHVRLQFRRWLTVQDGFFDEATVYANGIPLWQNLGTDQNGEYNHVDREWRFVDLDASQAAESGALQVRFELAADPTIELGGWNIDDVCLVAWTPPPVDTSTEPSSDSLRSHKTRVLDASGGCSVSVGDPERAASWATALVALALGSFARRRVTAERRLGSSRSRRSSRRRHCTARTS